MEFAKVAAAPLSAPLELNVEEAFLKQCLGTPFSGHPDMEGMLSYSEQALNRLSERDSKCDRILKFFNQVPKNVEIRKLIPSLDDHVVEFRPSVLDEKRHPHVSFRYRLALEETSDHHWNLSLFVPFDEINYSWLQKVAFPRLLKWFAEVGEEKNNTISNRLVDMEDYSQFYYKIKNNWGQRIAAAWTERTDPQKFVYEDCAIAAYLISYWRQKGFFPQRFCDVGCGNGLLVHLLQKMKVNGYGIDLRERKVWTEFIGTDLREKALNPEEDLLSDSDFLIGNHTDELTPSRSNFFLLPCCPYDFYNRFQRKRGVAASSVYSSYLLFIRNICLRMGYCVEEDRLKIPSTKRHCFVCTVPSGGLVENVENVISNILPRSSLPNFVPREKFERVRNCSKLSREFQQMLITKIFTHLFELSPKETAVRWGEGRSCSLKEIADLLDEEEKAQLRDSDGGLQTFMKNQHQIFKVVKGTVSIRNWAETGSRRVEGKLKTRDCWFHKYHSYGCPLSAEKCSYKH
uniref:tRNA (uracil-O(2)-)-methyltransferase n=1 Tax=Elaeophora elaphi TaxID=1147741 RepID=A0A0R3RHP9_9BILA